MVPLDESGELSQAIDHISARSWKGDGHVRNVDLSACWREGRRICESEYEPASSLLKRLEEIGVDTLCPFGGDVSEPNFWADDDEMSEDEILKEQSYAHGALNTGFEHQNISGHAPIADTNEMDVEDLAGIELPETLSSSYILLPQFHEAHLDESHLHESLPRPINNQQQAAPGKPGTQPKAKISPTIELNGESVYKARVTRDYNKSGSSIKCFGSSADRLKRWAGLARYHHQDNSFTALNDRPDEPILASNDVAVALVRSGPAEKQRVWIAFVSRSGSI